MCAGFAHLDTKSNIVVCSRVLPFFACYRAICRLCVALPYAIPIPVCFAFYYEKNKGL